MQKAPLGTFSSLKPPSAAASQYRQQAELYNTAMRTLRRQARRGDAQAAITAIGLRDNANVEGGFTPGGIRRAEEFQGQIAGREQQLQRDAEAAETANRLDRRRAALALGGGEQRAPQTRTGAALDIMEGYMDQSDEGTMKFRRGQEAARGMGVERPEAVIEGSDDDLRLKYRRTIDSALGEARSPEEVAKLRERAARFGGVSGEDFDRRAKWWETNRR